MNAYSADNTNTHTYRGPAPVLIAGDSDAALARAARTVEGSGVRIADKVRLEDAPARIERQVTASAYGSSLATMPATRWTGCWSR